MHGKMAICPEMMILWIQAIKHLHLYILKLSQTYCCHFYWCYHVTLSRYWNVIILINTIAPHLICVHFISNMQHFFLIWLGRLHYLYNYRFS